MKRNISFAAIGLVAMVAVIVFISYSEGHAEPGGPRGDKMRAFRGHGPGGRPGSDFGPGKMYGRMGEHGGEIAIRILTSDKAVEELGLSEEQVEKIKDVHYNTHEDAIDLEAQIRKAELQLRKMWDTEESKREGILAQIDKVGGLHTERRKVGVSVRLAIHETVSSEQRDKINKFMKKRAAERRMDHRRHDRRGPRSDDRPPRGRRGRDWDEGRRRGPFERGEHGLLDERSVSDRASQ